MGEEKEEIIPVRCRCGWRLFDVDVRTQGIVKAKCPRCKAVMAITIRNKQYRCTEQIAARVK
jgi:phage FluMu protein Com